MSRAVWICYNYVTSCQNYNISIGKYLGKTVQNFEPVSSAEEQEDPSNVSLHLPPGTYLLPQTKRLQMFKVLVKLYLQQNYE